MKYWQYVSPACMTEESDAEDSETGGDRIITHRLVWRSECMSHAIINTLKSHLGMGISHSSAFSPRAGGKPQNRIA